MPVTPLRPSDPVQVGPHRLLARLGQGGMGTVYLGVAPDERAVAVKVLRDGVADPAARDRFRHELRALRRVRGPHLVEVLDADVDADMPYLVTRFIPGQRLDDLVAAAGPLPGRELHQVARGLAEALAALHAADVVHRDLTPGNVLVLDGQPHVIDLGLATAADVTALTHSGLVVGTPGYLAPEQVRGWAISPAVDIHAWGATVAFAATGRPPYGMGRPEAVLYRIVHDVPDLAGLQPPLDRLVAAAMDPDPLQRPAARELLAELGGASAAEPVTVHLPHDVDPRSIDVTTLLAFDARRPTRGAPEPARELVASSSGAYRTPPGGFELPAYDDDTEAREPELLPWQDEPAPAPRPHPARTLQLLATGLAGVGLVAAGTLVAPVLGAVAVLGLLTALRAVGRSSDRLRDRRERRGGRRRDPMVTTLGAPWQLLRGLVDTALSLPLLVAAAALPAGAVWLLDPEVSGLERPELTAATAAAVGLVTGLRREAHRPSRRMLRGALVRVTPHTRSAVAVLLPVVALAGLLLAAAEGAAPTYWPLDQR